MKWTQQLKFWFAAKTAEFKLKNTKLPEPKVLPTTDTSKTIVVEPVKSQNEYDLPKKTGMSAGK